MYVTNSFRHICFRQKEIIVSHAVDNKLTWNLMHFKGNMQLQFLFAIDIVSVQELLLFSARILYSIGRRNFTVKQHTVSDLFGWNILTLNVVINFVFLVSCIYESVQKHACIYIFVFKLRPVYVMFEFMFSWTIVTKILIALHLFSIIYFISVYKL